jgi:shikimate kinase
MERNRIIYLIGFMGSGKTTAGKKLASLLKWSFTDLDKEIEKYTGLTIPDIFSGKGEAFFRTVESEMLKNLSLQKEIVISTGGGTPCFSANMDHMLKTGITVYLRMTPSQLAGRLLHAKGERPLIANKTGEELLDFIGKKLAERKDYYEKAEIIVNGRNLDINTLLAILSSKFGL